jgi:hypothetical protein
MVIIENNSTHIIREWKGIYGYFAPDEAYIDDLWEDLIGAFDYLLEMTPRVDFNILGISGGINSGEDVDMTMSMTCLSPRLGSKDAIYFLDENGDPLTSVIAVGGDQTISAYPQFALPADLNSTGYAVLVGNNYTGYTKFLLTTGGTFGGLDTLLLVAGVGIAVVLVAIVVIVYMKQKS